MQFVSATHTHVLPTNMDYKVRWNKNMLRGGTQEEEGRAPDRNTGRAQNDYYGSAPLPRRCRGRRTPRSELSRT